MLVLNSTAGCLVVCHLLLSLQQEMTFCLRIPHTLWSHVCGTGVPCSVLKGSRSPLTLLDEGNLTPFFFSHPEYKTASCIPLNKYLVKEWTNSLGCFFVFFVFFEIIIWKNRSTDWKQQMLLFLLISPVALDIPFLCFLHTTHTHTSNRNLTNKMLEPSDHDSVTILQNDYDNVRYPPCI